MKTGICAIIKNEHRYLGEWLSYHFELGVDEIHLFEDIGSDSHQDITGDFSDVVLSGFPIIKDGISLEVESNGVVRQYLLYNWFIDNYREEFDWVAFIDIDEYIFLNDSETLESILSKYNDYPGLVMSWKQIGASGHIVRPKGSIVSNYTEQSQGLKIDVGWNYKSFFNMKVGSKMFNPHSAIGGVKVDLSKEYSLEDFSSVWINHYFTKSWEDWTERFKVRGDLAHNRRKIEDFFEYNPDMNHLKEKLINNLK